MFPALAKFLCTVLSLIVVKLVLLLIAIAYYTLAERKIMAAVQRRSGPNVVGLWGLLQPLADGLKLFGKELVIPSHANSRIFLFAPLATFAFALAAWYVIPFNMFDHSERLSIDAVIQLTIDTSVLPPVEAVQPAQPIQPRPVKISQDQSFPTFLLFFPPN